MTSLLAHFAPARGFPPGQVIPATIVFLAIAASTALPPWRSTATPACAARWSTAQTIPSVANREANGPVRAVPAGNRASERVGTATMCPPSHCQMPSYVVQ